MAEYRSKYKGAQIDGKLDQVTDLAQEVGNIKPTAVECTETGSADTPVTIYPNKFYVWGEVSSLYLALATVKAEGSTTAVTGADEFMLEFSTGSTAPTVGLPSGVEWNDTPSFLANKTYQLSIKNNYGLIAEF